MVRFSALSKASIKSRAISTYRAQNVLSQTVSDEREGYRRPKLNAAWWNNINSFFQFMKSCKVTHEIKIYRPIILPVVLYGRETWSLTFRKERSVWMLRRIFGPKRNEVTGEWRKLHNEEHNVLYSSPNIVRVIKSRRMRWVGHVARTGEWRGVYRVLVGKSGGKRPLGRTRRRWEDNITMDLQEVGCGSMDWIEQVRDKDRWRALVNAVMNIRGFIKWGEFLD